MLANHNAIESGSVIERSLRLINASSQYLTRTPGVAGNRMTWTLSLWIKRGTLGVQNNLFTAGDGTQTNRLQLAFESNDTLTLVSTIASTPTTLRGTTAVYRDPSAFYHITVMFDTTQATAANRVRIFVGNTEVIVFTTNNNLAQNATSFVNNTNPHVLGWAFGANYCDGSISNVDFVDGYALTPDYFAEVNSLGQWVAKKYTGFYGTQGSYLTFKNGVSTTTLGYDLSGNGNNWTLTNFTRSAGINDCWVLDTPTVGAQGLTQPSGNYAIINPLDSSATLLASNLHVGVSAANTWYDGVSSIHFPKGGKYYIEGTLTVASSANIGITKAELNGKIHSQLDTFRSVYEQAGTITRTGTGIGDTTGLVSYTTNDVIGVAFDTINGILSFYKNNVLINSVTNSVYITNNWKFYVGVYNATFQVNFGQRAYVYTPPIGYKSLCTTNLPVPSIVDPSQHFNIKLSTGANIKSDSESLFTNEFEWIKDRANVNNHQLIDSVRGSNAVLQSNTTAAETTYTAPTGSSIGWVWRASDSAPVANTNGTITSQVSANQLAGFSIVTYTGTGAIGTIGHGLASAPKLTITKSASIGGAQYGWPVYHANMDTSLPANYVIGLQDTAARFADSTYYNNTNPSSSVLTVGTNLSTNQNTTRYVSYCFVEVSGYSKIGSYIGNGSVDGPFVYTGFKPRFIMIKRIDVADSWIIFDTARSPNNVTQIYLVPNNTAAEATLSTILIDVVSNGFKLRGTYSALNTSASTYIYAAFAGRPFQYTNAQ